MDQCSIRDPDCSDGWVPVIQVLVDGQVVDERPFGLSVIGDEGKRADALKVEPGQVAMEANKPCRGCRPDYVHPSLRRKRSPEPTSDQVRQRTRAAWWDDGPTPPPPPTGAIPLGSGQ